MREALKTAVTILVAAGIPVAMFSAWLGHTAYCAWVAESEEVSGVVPATKDGVTYLVVSGHSEKVTSNGSKSHGVSTTEYPRLTSYRLADGEKVATRQYASVFLRFSYDDTSVHAFATGAGGVWVMATNPEVSLHVVDPVTLADVLAYPALKARIPALAPDILIEPGMMSDPVHESAGNLAFRLKSGPWVSLDPKAVTAQTSTEEPKEDERWGSRAVDAVVRARPEILEPRIFTAFDLDGREDSTLSFVASQTSLDREESAVKFTRWDTSGATPVEGWTTTVSAVKPACCNARVWRTEGLDVLWYEDWLIAFDDATGKTRWAHRL